MNKFYIISVSLLTFVLPAIGVSAEMMTNNGTSFSLELAGKWFIFSAVGLRLFLAGIKQVSNPAFTAKEIFHMEGTESFPVLRELGFANICFGLIGIVSLFFPQWRVVSAFGSGIYYGIAGIQHLFTKETGINEKFAMITDLIIFIFLAVYFIKVI